MSTHDMRHKQQEATLRVKLLALGFTLVIAIIAALITRFDTMRRKHLRTAKSQFTLDTVQHGDILFFCDSNTSLKHRAICGYLGTIYYHVALVISISRTPHVVHVIDKEFYHTQTSGLSIDPLSKVLATYPPESIIAIFRPKRPQSSSTIVHHARKIATHQTYFPSITLAYLKHLLTPDPSPPAHHTNCSLFMGLLLQQLGDTYLKPKYHMYDDPFTYYTPTRLFKLLKASKRNIQYLGTFRVT